MKVVWISIMVKLESGNLHKCAFRKEFKARNTKSALIKVKNIFKKCLSEAFEIGLVINAKIEGLEIGDPKYDF